MTHAGFIARVTAYLVKKLGPTVMKCLIAALTTYLMTPKKGLSDEGMATLANSFKLKCEKCKAIAWDDATIADEDNTRNIVSL